MSGRTAAELELEALRKGLISAIGLELEEEYGDGVLLHAVKHLVERLDERDASIEDVKAMLTEIGVPEDRNSDRGDLLWRLGWLEGAIRSRRDAS